MEVSTKAKRAENAMRYRRAAREIPRASLASLRARDLARLFKARHGYELPDDDGGRDDARLMVHHLAMLSKGRTRILTWLGLWTPWMQFSELRALLEAAETKPLRFKADTLARKLGLRMAERTALRITTIGAIDASPAEREKQRCERAKAAKVAKRRAAGSRPRAEYLAELRSRRAPPWKHLGMSRRTWYRKGKPLAPPT
jgi:hypothetical protein